MCVSTRVASYLDEEGIKYDTVNYAHTSTSVGSAITAHIRTETIAKVVVLEDHENRHLMAILPASRKVNLRKLNDKLDVNMHLADEEQVYKMFSRCGHGAVPAFGQAYNMNSIYDESLDQLNDVYLEAGDHETLIHLSKAQFGKLMTNTKRSQFSNETYY